MPIPKAVFKMHTQLLTENTFLEYYWDLHNNIPQHTKTYQIWRLRKHCSLKELMQ